MVGNSLNICDKVREYKTEFDCTGTVSKTLNMGVFKLVTQTVDNLFKRFNL